MVFLYKFCTPNGDTKEEVSDIGEPVLAPGTEVGKGRTGGDWEEKEEGGVGGGG